MPKHNIKIEYGSTNTVIVKAELELDDEQFDKYSDFLIWLKNNRRSKGQIKEKCEA